MRPMVWIPVALVLCASVLAPAPVDAQGSEFTLSAGWFLPGGADFEDTDAGPGAVGVLRWRTGDRFSFGAGAHWSTHAVDFSDDHYDIVGAFVEPRVHGGAEGRVEPFAGLRLAWVRQSIRVGTESRAAGGVAVGAVGGVRLAASGPVGVEVALGFTGLRFGDFTAGDRVLGGTDSSGRAVSLAVGLSVRP